MTLSSARVAGFLGGRAIFRGNRGVVSLTVVLMALIYAQLLFIPSLIQGATDQIQAELRGSTSSNIVITPRNGLTISDPQSLLAQLRATRGVAAATATVLSGTQVSSGNRTGSWSIFGVDPKSYSETFTIPDQLIEGSFLQPGANDEIVLGVGIAGAGREEEASYRSSLQSVHAGDTVTVTMLDGTKHDLKVRGIYRTGLQQANLQGFVSTATAKKLLPALDDQASAAYVKTDELGDEAAVIAAVAPSRPDLEFETWQKITSNAKDITGTFDIIKSILNAVSLFVAAITVFIVTYVDLVNRRRTIGIERAIGVTGSAISGSYVLKAIAFALVGVVLGAALYFTIVVPLVDRHPFQFPIGPVRLSVTGGELRRDAIVLVVVAMVGALVPSIRAVRARILDAIWR